MRFLPAFTEQIQKTRLLLAFLLLAAPLLLAAIHADTPPQNVQARYTVTDLGTLPSVATDVALGLNSSGHVSLWQESPSGTVHAAVWSAKGAEDLGTCPGYQSSIAHFINSKGGTVGWVVSGRNLVDSLATMRAFVFDGKLRLLGTLGGKNSRAMAENQRGEVAGEAQTPSGDPHAFLFHSNRMIDLGTLPGGKMSIANCINSAGEVAGAADTGKDSRHAVLWVKGKIQDLGTLPNGRESYATAINDKGQVAGFAQTPDGYHAFLWTKGKMEDLGTLADDPSNAKSLNNLDQIVGSASVGHFTLHGYIWQNGKMVDLNTLIPSNSGWEITDAFAINDTGQIACCGHGRDDTLHAFLLTPRSRTPIMKSTEGREHAQGQ